MEQFESLIIIEGSPLIIYLPHKIGGTTGVQITFSSPQTLDFTGLLEKATESAVADE